MNAAIAASYGIAMQLSPTDQQLLIQEGAEALRQGRFAAARDRLEQLAAAGSTSGVAWMLLALSRRAVDDAEAEEEAINRLLEIEPQSVRGHVMKGDCRAHAGDEVNACYFYRSAVRLAEGKQLPDEIWAEVRRGEQALTELEGAAHARREAKLNARGLPADSWSPRFQQALDLAAGKRKLYLQQPTFFNYPGLPHIQFYDPAEFDWAPAIEAAAGVIRDELAELLKDGTGDFRAYIQGAEGALRMDKNKELVANKDWSALFLCENGWMVPKVVERCPRTWDAVMKAPVPRISGWGPTAMFSLLKAIEHEAWNDSGEDRVVLIFDIWRPELSEQERRELTALFSD
jgi:tetratricopeptide (TPR) repeat protein